MDVVTSVIWGIELNDEVDRRDLYVLAYTLDPRHTMKAYIESTSSDVSADEDALLSVAKLKEGIRSLLLLLLAMKIQHGAVDIVEQLGVIFDGIAAAEEDNHLLLLLLHPS